MRIVGKNDSFRDDLARLRRNGGLVPLNNRRVCNALTAVGWEAVAYTPPKHRRRAARNDAPPSQAIYVSKNSGFSVSVYGNPQGEPLTENQIEALGMNLKAAGYSVYRYDPSGYERGRDAQRVYVYLLSEEAKTALDREEMASAISDNF